MPPHLASAPNINHLWAGLLVEELVRQGTTFFVVCPGSRSTPLAVAVGQNPRAEALVHWDERAAAFVALGWGRATGRPAAVVTTSGTAVANLLPAAVEADADGVPLLLITADRPPELRETGANQTVRQPPVFQDVTRWFLDWPVPTADVPARWVLSTAAHAVHRATAPPGPVHLNLPFREPLGGEADGTDVAGYLGGVEDRAVAGPRLMKPDRVDADSNWDWVLAPGGAFTSDDARAPDERYPPPHAERGVIVVGDLRSEDTKPLVWGGGLREVATHLGWPILPDVRAPAFFRRSDRFALSADAPVVPNVDLVLTSPAFCERQRPDYVLHLGGRVVSKRLSRFLSDSQPARYVQVSMDPRRQDPNGIVTDVVRLPVPRHVKSLVQEVRRTLRRGAGWSWPRSWVRASEVVEAVVAGSLGDLSEPAVARAVSRPGTVVVAAASMPIRDVEAFVPAAGRWACTVVANRGASGIDGTLATAAGYGRGAGKAVTVLIGDLALLHDQTSLALLRTGPPVVVVVINNDGGGIFHRLPIAGGAEAGGAGALDADTFERFFGTPHGLGFEDAARQVGLAYHRPETMPAFEAALDEAVRSGASALLEVRTDREEQAALRRRIEAAAAAAVDAALAAPPDA